MLVRKLKIPITETNGYGVHVGSGMTVKGKGICKGVVLYMQAVVVIEEYFYQGRDEMREGIHGLVENL